MRSGYSHTGSLPEGLGLLSMDGHSSCPPVLSTVPFLSLDLRMACLLAAFRRLGPSSTRPHSPQGNKPPLTIPVSSGVSPPPLLASPLHATCFYGRPTLAPGFSNRRNPKRTCTFLNNAERGKQRPAFAGPAGRAAGRERPEQGQRPSPAPPQGTTLSVSASGAPARSCGSTCAVSGFMLCTC